MILSIIISTVAATDFSKFEPRFKSLVGDRLLNLGNDPETDTRNSVCPPHPPGYRIHEFGIKNPDEHHWFCILFKVDLENNKLLIAGIGHIDYEVSTYWNPDGPL